MLKTLGMRIMYKYPRAYMRMVWRNTLNKDERIAFKMLGCVHIGFLTLYTIDKTVTYIDDTISKDKDPPFGYYHSER